MYYIGIDIGGMSFKVGLVDENGKVVYKTKMTAVLNDTDSAVSGLVEKIQQTLDENSLTVKDIYGIGIGSPGIISSKEGVIECAYNLGWIKFDIVNRLKKYFDTEIKLSNDANVAALGEAVFGAAKGYNDVVMVTLGTGVGGGVVIDGKLYEGGESKGTELGHVTLIYGGEKCSCGRSGCVETYVSATALIRQTKNAMKNDKDTMMWQIVDGDIEKVDGQTAFKAFKAGDKVGTDVVNTYTAYLGESLMNFMNIFRPQIIVIGGGISGEGKYYTDMIEKYCADRHYGFLHAPVVKIVTASNGNDAGIIGAASLIKA